MAINHLNKTGVSWLITKIKTALASYVKTSDLFDKIYPVGSIYFSVSSTNPGDLFGGTWAAWGSGRVPVGVKTSDSKFSTVEKTGGAKTVTLTTDQIPAHTHTDTNYFSDSSVTQSSYALSYATYGKNYRDAGTGQVVGSTGGGSSHNNLQPYITCYMWKRTA